MWLSRRIRARVPWNVELNLILTDDILQSKMLPVHDNLYSSHKRIYYLALGPREIDCVLTDNMSVTGESYYGSGQRRSMSSDDTMQLIPDRHTHSLFHCFVASVIGNIYQSHCCHVACPTRPTIQHLTNIRHFGNKLLLNGWWINVVERLLIDRTRKFCLSWTLTHKQSILSTDYYTWL